MNLVLTVAIYGLEKRLRFTVNVHTKCDAVGYTQSPASKLSTIQFLWQRFRSSFIYIFFSFQFHSFPFYMLLSILPPPDSIFLASGNNRNEICAHKRNCMKKKKK